MGFVALSFLAGLLTILNPCVLPLVPLVVVGANADDWVRPVAMALGLAFTFAVVGVTISATGAEIGSIDAIRWPAGLMLMLLGALVALGTATGWMSTVMTPLTTFGDQLARRLPASGPIGAAGLGALLALIWAPCIGPTMGAAIVMASSSGTASTAAIAMCAFAIGAAVSLLLAGRILRGAAKATRAKVQFSARWMRTALGVTFVLIGVGAITGFDHVLAGWIVERMPDWFVTAATVV